MITNLRFQHFKSWNDTGELRFAPLTGFFGSNSSGKTAILRFLLMLKQTVDSNDRQLFLELNGAYAELGSFEEVIFNNDINSELSFQMGLDFVQKNNNFFHIMMLFVRLGSELSLVNQINIKSSLIFDKNSIMLNKLLYTFGFPNGELGSFSFEKNTDDDKYIYRSWLMESDRNTPEVKDIVLPKSKFYHFPYELLDKIPDLFAIYELPQIFEEQFRDIQYLGPIRHDPQRFYQWTGENRSLGNRGEHAVLVLLADQKRDPEARLAKKVAIWLKQLGLIADFRLHQIAPNVDLHEVRVKIKPNAAEVLLTDVGFGVAQILPVLVLCASAKPGSTIILEQPEIHLHPAVQSNLADILIETIKRGVQIVLESHSEHLLHRLQRRIAEEVLSNTDTALYFCDMDDTGTSHAVPLDVDQYGNIRNWPKDFFGDEMADLAALSRETIRRKKAEAGR
ncbi:AAA family ATPase [Herpetosiphon geysericola]|uniref:DUF3696 domain-containing protein n=1 Tax=Herpetosiphon geysericola TaxID=70996 RepID=A0A0P6XFE0_9CHLR|nr:DUF3696 domain-containing protein [Herpetosiphon geysericola]KPL81980.1 hypothetical protein SE18_20545 [Herpetosiphon geysericola]